MRVVNVADMCCGVFNCVRLFLSGNWSQKRVASVDFREKSWCLACASDDFLRCSLVSCQFQTDKFLRNKDSRHKKAVRNER